jgi:hypothetical protein
MNKVGFFVIALVVLIGGFFVTNWILSINQPVPDWKFTDDASLAVAAKAAGFRSSADIIGYVDSVSRIDPGNVTVGGWAANLSGDGAPMTLMVFVDGHRAAYFRTDGARPDVTALIKGNPQANPDASKNTLYASSFSCPVGGQFFVVAITKDKRYAPLITHPHICP